MTRTIPYRLVANAALLLTLAGCGGEAVEETDIAATDPAAVDATATAPTGGAATTGAFLDPNAATATDLQAAGLTPEAAEAVVAGRPYTNNLGVDQVLSAQNVSDEQRDSVYARVWMPIDPNTASDEEILLIPGVGDRMLHEFEEYRPWTSVDHFRREIGKYVDAAELARLESYVRLPS